MVLRFFFNQKSLEEKSIELANDIESSFQSQSKEVEKLLNSSEIKYDFLLRHRGTAYHFSDDNYYNRFKDSEVGR